MSHQRPPSHCANCGAELSPNARACPECGADERTGWREQDYTDGLDLPDDEDTSEAHARFIRELEGNPEGTRAPKRLLIWAIAIAVVIALLAGMFFMR